MKLLLDQGLPRATVRHLASIGIPAEHVGELGMASASDAEILDFARHKQSIVVTLDADFHQLLAIRQDKAPSIVRIRVSGLKADRLAAILQNVLAVSGTELAAGAAASVTRGRVRVRMLPLRR